APEMGGGWIKRVSLALSLRRQPDFAFASYSETSIYVGAKCDLPDESAAGLNDQRKTLWRPVR
ncbi:hypothetical protein, partial [Rhizobium sullae]|uniref:hypothetical protein n=1 Tax=Rhizobium sullae TaxID=50338 RepID=UPI001ADF9443